MIPIEKVQLLKLRDLKPMLKSKKQLYKFWKEKNVTMKNLTKSLKKFKRRRNMTLLLQKLLMKPPYRD
jgi:hypothetical protein